MKKMRFYLLIILVLSSYNILAQNASHDYKQFIKEYKKLYRKNIRVLNFDCDMANKRSTYFSVDSAGNLSNTTKNVHFVSFKDVQIINNIILDKRCYKSKTYEDGKGCFNPRMGILFYTKDSLKILGRLDICLECHSLEFENFTTSNTFQIGFFRYGLIKMQYLCKHLGLACCEG